MCLRAYIPRIAITDILVYKTVKLLGTPLKTEPQNNGILISRFLYESLIQHAAFRPGDLLIGEWGDKESKSVLWNCILNLTRGYITSGYIHAFLTESRAQEEAQWIRVERRKVLKCIIPRGTIYYIDKRSGTIASRKLQIPNL